MADCVQIWYVGWGSLTKRLPQVMGGVHPHVHTAHVRTPFPLMFRLLLLGNGWADCVEIWHALGDPLATVYAVVTGGVSLHVRTCARAHRTSVSQERLGRLCSNLVCGLGVITYILSTSHGWCTSARAHVPTPPPYLKNRLTDCAKI